MFDIKNKMFDISNWLHTVPFGLLNQDKLVELS